MGISQTDSQIKKYNDSIRKKYEGQSKTKKGPLTKKEKEKNKKQQKNVKGQGSNVEGILRTGEKQSEYSATRKKKPVKAMMGKAMKMKKK